MNTPTYIFQEFKCNKCPGFFVIRLNAAITGKVLMVCPKCRRKHQRDVIKGVIKDVGKQSDESQIPEISIPLAAFSTTPRTKLLYRAHNHMAPYDRENRDGATIKSVDDLIDPLDFSLYGGQ